LFFTNKRKGRAASVVFLFFTNERKEELYSCSSLTKERKSYCCRIHKKIVSLFVIAKNKVILQLHM
jgi:hypothetical protein